MPRKIVQLVATTVDAYATRLFALDDDGRPWHLMLNELARSPYPVQWVPLPSLPEREG